MGVSHLAKGREHPGQVCKSSQGKHTPTHTHRGRKTELPNESDLDTNMQISQKRFMESSTKDVNPRHFVTVIPNEQLWVFVCTDLFSLDMTKALHA